MTKAVAFAHTIGSYRQCTVAAEEVVDTVAGGMVVEEVGMVVEAAAVDVVGVGVGPTIAKSMATKEVAAVAAAVATEVEAEAITAAAVAVAAAAVSMQWRQMRRQPLRRRCAEVVTI